MAISSNHFGYLENGSAEICRDFKTFCCSGVLVCFGVDRGREQDRAVSLSLVLNLKSDPDKDSTWQPTVTSFPPPLFLLLFPLCAFYPSTVLLSGGEEKIEVIYRSEWHSVLLAGSCRSDGLLAWIPSSTRKLKLQCLELSGKPPMVLLWLLSNR